MVSWLKKRWEQILAIGWKFVAYQIFSFSFSYFAYVWAMNSFGLRGWLGMTMISLVLSVYLFWHYDHKGIDWLFVRATRDWEKSTNKTSNWFRRMLVRISSSRNKPSRIPVFVVASLDIDPLIVAVHYRESHFNGIRWSDWGLLVASVLIANLYRGLRGGLLIKLWHFFLGILSWLIQYF